VNKQGTEEQKDCHFGPGVEHLARMGAGKAEPDRLGKVTGRIVMQERPSQGQKSVWTGRDLGRALRCSSCRTLEQEKA